jgi:hypothetical protein
LTIGWGGRNLFTRARFSPAANLSLSSLTETERIAHYRELAAQFREWATSETNEEARAGLLDMARQYERPASDAKARIASFPKTPSRG